MATHDIGPRDGASLTEAAAHALDELLAQRRQEVLDEAINAARGQEITAADVVRAYYSDDERPLLYEVAEASRSAPLRPRLILTVALLALVTVGTLYVSQLIGVGGEQPFNALSVAGMIGIVLSFAAASAAIVLQYRFARRSRESQERWTRIAEQGNDAGNYGHTMKTPRSLTEVQQRGLFLSKWVSVEEDLRRLAVMLRPETEQQAWSFRPIGSLMADLTSAGVIDRELSSNIRQIVTVRNRVAHQESVSQSQMEAGLELLDEVEQRLSDLRKEMS